MGDTWNNEFSFYIQFIKEKEMNLFGLEIHLKSSNNKFIRQNECHQAQNKIRQEILTLKEDLRNLFNTRFEDFKDFIIKNGK